MVYFHSDTLLAHFRSHSTLPPQSGCAGMKFDRQAVHFSDDLVTRSIVKVEPAPTALKVSQSRSEVDGSPKESAPESWEQIVEKIRYSSSVSTWAWWWVF